MNPDDIWGNSIPVSSSNLNAVFYAGDADQPTLYVRFNNRRKYFYRNVPRRVFEALLAAPSKGIYFNEHIRFSYDYKEIK